MKKELYKKLISFLILISIISPSIILPIESRAQWAVTDPVHTSITGAKWAWDKIVEYGEKYGRIVARLFARALIQMLTQDIVNWINSGFEGSPAFMTNPEGFLANLTDRAIGEFIFEGPLGFLCDPFKLQVKINLGLQYSGYDSGFNCTLSGVIGNIEGAYEDFVGGDFIGGGGWDSWMQLAANPQNTPQGASMMAEGALEVKLAGIENINLLEASWGSGALSLKECKEKTFEVKKDPNNSFAGVTRTPVGTERKFIGHSGYATGTSITATHANTQNQYGGNTIVNIEKETTCETKTPGAVIVDNLKFVTTGPLRSLEMSGVLSDGINAIIGALATTLITMTINKVKTGLLGGDQPAYVDYMAQYENERNKAVNSLNAETERQREESEGTTAVAKTPLETKRDSAKIDINNYLERNNSYLKTYETVKKILIDAKNEFQRAKACCQTYSIGGSNPNSSRAGLIQTNLIDVILGSNVNSGLPMSIMKIDIEIDINKKNITDLEDLLYKINNAKTEEEIDSKVGEMAVIVKHTKEPPSNLEANTKSWLDLNYRNYSESPCLISKTW